MTTHIHFIGFGDLAATTAYTLALLTTKELKITANDINPNQKGNADDLKPIIKIGWEPQPSLTADLYILTAGKTRKPGQTKQSLAEENGTIACQAMRKALQETPTIVATNPPEETSDTLKSLGYNTTPFGIETDQLRAEYYGGHVHGTHTTIKGKKEVVEKVINLNEQVLRTKGKTIYTPAMALTNRILTEIRA